MGLSTDTVDQLGAAAVDLLDKVDNTVELWVHGVEAAYTNASAKAHQANPRDTLVVVDVELRVRVRRPCRLERDRDEVLAEDV